MKNLPLFFGVLLGTLILVIGVAFAFTKKVNTPVDMTRVLGDARNATGSATPKVTVVEFSDLQCPACAAAEPTVRAITLANPDTVKLVYRQFPLVTIHKNALAASQASEVARSVGKFWEFHHILLDRQTDWDKLSGDDAHKKFIEYAGLIGIPAELMEQGIKDGTFNDDVTADMADGDALGVNATPTFYVNGVKTEVSALQQAVANALQQ